MLEKVHICVHARAKYLYSIYIRRWHQIAKRDIKGGGLQRSTQKLVSSTYSEPNTPKDDTDEAKMYRAHMAVWPFAAEKMKLSNQMSLACKSTNFPNNHNLNTSTVAIVDTKAPRRRGYTGKAMVATAPTEKPNMK